jgi:hypothetical protein|tara:strand:- start:633 stop:995 length:363 start_codon:yes stop_codon:yes gene_type:complete
MTLIKNTADSLEDGIKIMMNAAKDDYKEWSSKGSDGMSEYTKEQVAKWDDSVTVKHGRKFIKVIRDNGVFAFICKTDFKHFKIGDVLKPAGYNAPALNQPRGNVLTGNYFIRWTGPLYLN